jgi:hypothetical protein
MRICKKDGSCLSCLILDGELYDTESELEDHPNGRCSVIPIVRGQDAPEWNKGRDWLESQSPEKQIEVMGRTRWDMWQNGTPLDAFAGKSHSDVWGDAPRVVPLRDLGAA